MATAHSDQGVTGSDESGAGGVASPGLAPLVGWTAGTVFVLLALQQSLRLPSAWGIEDWLGWRRVDALAAVVQDWCLHPPGLLLAAAYLLIDQALFVPLYAALALRLASGLRASMAGGQSATGRRVRRLLGPGLATTLAALVVADTLENAAGLRNQGLPWWVFGCALAAALSFAAALWPAPMPRPRLHLPLRWTARRGLALGALLLLAALLAAPWASAGCAGDFGPSGSLAAAHGAKLLLTPALVLLLAVGALSWWFGVELDPLVQTRARDARAALRRLAAGVVGRSRYVLLIVALYAGLTLALDQCRDVLLALADVPDVGMVLWLQRLPVLALGALSSGLFAHACWLWARLAGMVQRPGLDMPADPSVVAAVGGFARDWARVLAVLPLVAVCVLVAFTLGDLAIAHRQAAAGVDAAAAWRWALSAAMLFGFAAGAIGMAWLLVRLRRRPPGTDPALYYNSEPDVHELVWYRAGGLHKAMDRRRWSPLWVAGVLTRPWSLPIVALLGMAGLRVAQSLAPDALAVTPPALVLATLALTWWLGVLGLLALWEQRHSLPWVLVPLALVGALSALGLTASHELAWPAAIDLPALQRQGRTALLMLVLCALACWWAAVADAQHWARTAPLRRRWLVGVLAFGLTYGVLLLLDRQARDAPVAASAAVPAPLSSAPAPRLDAALGLWLDAAAAAGLAPGPLYLVAAEGGGIRSAYWTAQVLAALGAADRPAEFSRRTLLLSGVSGGSMGIAVHRACSRLAADGTRTVSGCIDEAFGRLDALSPLLGGLLFDDVLSRVLPLSRGTAPWRCTQPGCAHVDRAAMFERAWMRVLAPLAEPLQAVQPGEPLLAFNSTWVETGNRTVAASLPLARDAFAGAAQLDRCLGGDSRLVTAAHASARFPVTNPLAGVRARGEPDPDCRSGGHLIDGGYFDNSALPTVLDALAAIGPRLHAGGWVPRVILIRNGRRPRVCDAGADGAPPPSCIRPAVGPRSDPLELDMPAERRRLRLYADALGPALALLNVSGVGAHGRASGAALRGVLGEVGRGCGESNIWLLDQVDDGSLVPLGWYLSPAARQALRRQVAATVPGYC